MSSPVDPDDAPAPGVRPFLRHPPAPAARPAPADTAPPGTVPPDTVPPAGEQAVLRPFVLTAGRVVGLDPEIGMETQVTVHPGARPARLPPEKRAIVALCAEPLSVAEISARLRLHLGVVRILVGDLRAAGQLDVHVLDTDFPDPDTIMRVIRGLRSIS